MYTTPNMMFHYFYRLFKHEAAEFLVCPNTVYWILFAM